MSGYIIFDMDGVLYDTERIGRDAWVYAADKLDIDNIEEATYHCIGMQAPPIHAYFVNRYGEDFPFDEFNAYAREYFQAELQKELPVKRGVYELLAWLRDNDYKIALATSTVRPIAMGYLERTGIAKYFDVEITGDMIKRGKPEPDIFIKAAEMLGADRHEVIVVEDSPNGVRAAHAAGIFCIMVPDLIAPDAEIKSKYSVCLPDLLAVRDYLTARAGNKGK